MKACILLLLAGTLLSGGCGTYRGIPTHGGGKRFDEEQRIVAGAIRQAVRDMDLKELGTRKVRIAMESIAQDGGGTIIWPGLQSASLTGSLSRNVEDANYPWTEHVTNVASAGGSLSYQAAPSFYPVAFSSQPDLAYLKGVLEMKARHDGIIINDAQPEAVLFILVDVLGTNRSRTDRLLVVDEDYTASCELTYYAVDTLSGQLIFRARQSGAMARYDEKHVLGSTQVQVERTMAPSAPTVPPVDRPAVTMAQTQPATRPAPAAPPAPAAYQATMQPLIRPAAPPAGGGK